MRTKYLVLRAEKPLSDSFVIAGSESWSTATGEPNNLTIETFDGQARDVAELREDPRNAAVVDADVILQLVEPTTRRVEGRDSAGMTGDGRFPLGLVAVGAHTSPFTGQGVTVAVIDTGADIKHCAFAGKSIVPKNFTGMGGEADVTDSDGHGTHCAATVCGATVGDLRVGVAPGVAKLCIGKVIGASGSTLEMLLKAMVWAVLDQHASVVSMSLGYDLPGNAARMVEGGVDPRLATQAAMRQQADIIRGIGTLRAFLESQSPNVMFLAATGNESARPKLVMDSGLPASELLGVGAIGFDGTTWDIAPFSNGRATYVAPGVDVLSAKPGGGLVQMSGTSMATPHAAGVAALWTEKVRETGGIALTGAVRANMKVHAGRLRNHHASAFGAGVIQAPQSRLS